MSNSDVKLVLPYYDSEPHVCAMTMVSQDTLIGSFDSLPICYCASTYTSMYQAGKYYNQSTLDTNRFNMI